MFFILGSLLAKYNVMLKLFVPIHKLRRNRVLSIFYKDTVFVTLCFPYSFKMIQISYTVFSLWSLLA
jgi:hypothetical protein